MRILHGDDQGKVRTALQAAKELSLSKGKRLVTLEAKNLNPAILQDALGSQSLFGDEQLVVIENLLTGRPSQLQKEVLETLKNRLKEQSLPEVILVESKAAHASRVRSFQQLGAKAEQFKLSSALFSWLESLSPGTKKKPSMLAQFRSAQVRESDFVLHAMLVRQVRQLIQIKEGSQLKAAPFVIRKLQSQAREFSLKELLELHTALYALDRKQKTSQLQLSLGEELALLQVSL